MPHSELNKPIEERFLKSFMESILSARIQKKKFIWAEKTFGLPKPAQNSQIIRIENEKKEVIANTPTVHKQIISTQRRQLIMPPKVFPFKQGTKTVEISTPLATSSEIPEILTEKIISLLKNPRIKMIECPGSGKPLIVTNAGLTQVTSITLDDEEIKEMMKKISEKTRIPLIPGLFKAAIGSLIITAILSENIGTRFIIEKRPQNYSK